MARKGQAAQAEPQNAPPPPAREGGQHPALATRGKARAAGDLGVLKPGDPGYGASSPEPKGRGPRVQVEKDFLFDEDADPVDLIRVYDTHPDNKNEDVILFSGTKQQASKLHKLLGDHLKK